MKTDYAGIDYSLGKSNVDNKGFHFGVIHHSEVGHYWYEESEAMYFYYCPECGTELGEDYPEVDQCPNCEEEFDDMTFDMLDPDYFKYIQDGYKAFQSYDDPDIFIERSPYYTYAQFCSPCAPGAGYLMNWTDKNVGVKTYAFGHDWYESSQAPYPVYSVETDELVKPENI